MKRSLMIILILSLAAALWGCTGDQEEILDPVHFYYPKTDISFNTDDGVIGAETREASGCRENPTYLISVYLQGPQSEDFRRIYPAGTRLLSLKIVNNEARLLLSDSIAQLTGVDLTLACACLTVTAMELTGAQSVRIQAVNETLNGQDSITMDGSTLLLLDDSKSLNP